MKRLYMFKVGKSTLEDVITTVDGKEVKEQKKVVKDVEVFIKKPSHREIDEMSLFYSIQLSKLQTEGVATNIMILNSYKESGGLDSKNQVEAVNKLMEEINLKRNRYLKESAEKIENPALLEELKNLIAELDDYQFKLGGIFERSAESLAERRVILWSCLHLLFLKNGDVFTPVFTGSNYEERLDHYYNILDDESDEFKLERDIFFKGQILINSWFKKQVSNEEDFKLLESVIDEEPAE